MRRRWPAAKCVLLALLTASSWLAYLLLDSPVASHLSCDAPALRRAPWLAAFSQVGKFLVPFWLIAVLSWVRKQPRLIVRTLLAMGLVALIVTPLKLSVQRIRPMQEHREVFERWREGDLPSFSFPSGDTATAFAVAVVAAGVLNGWPKAIPFLLAAVVGVLRVLTLRHYASDAVAGVAVGLAAGWAACAIERRFAPLTFDFLRRWRYVGFWCVIFLPVLNVFDEDRLLFAFLGKFGPIVCAVLLLTWGQTWLRWLSGRGIGPPASVSRRISWGLPLLLLLAALAIVPCLSTTELFDRDEGYYVECAREMLEAGDPFVPRFSGRPWMEKPPLSYWAMALSMRLFGTNAFAARLPSALFGLLALVLTFWLGATLYSPSAGALSASILGTAILFGVVTRLALMDTALLCCLIVAMAGLWIFLSGSERKGLFLFYLGCGFGGLAKGPLGVALPIIVLIAYLAFSRNWGVLRRMRPLYGALLVLVIVGAWAIPAGLLTRGEYFYELVWVRSIAPIFTPLQGHGGSNLLQYLALIPAYIPVIILGMLPWTVFLWPAVRRTWSRTDPRTTLLAGWLLGPLVVFSLVRTKLPHHILPVFPALAIACGAYLGPMLSPGGVRVGSPGRAMRILLIVALLVLAGGVLLLPVAAGFRDTWIWFVPAAACLVWGALASDRWLKRMALPCALLTLTTAMLLCFAFVWQIGLPVMDRAKSAPQAADFLRRFYGESGVKKVALGRMSYREVSVVFYLGRPVEELRSHEELVTVLRSPAPVAIIMPEARFQRALREGLDVPHRILWRERVWLPEKNRWQDLVIVANRVSPPG